MAKRKEKMDDTKTIVQLLQNLLVIELWRGGLSQLSIARLLHMNTNTVNNMLKGVNRETVTTIRGKE
jgi:predicted transcriptional regulator